MTEASSHLRKTPLHPRHVSLGGRMVEFAGFEMPVQYRGILDEHKAVRTRAGMFDVSHMGEIWLEGPGALATIQKVTANDASRLEVGQSQYSVILNETGTIVDDTLVYRMDEARYLMVPNASNREKDFRWISDHAAEGTDLTNASEDWALLAVQGPLAVEIVSSLADAPVAELGSFRHAEAVVAGVRCIVSRTGYTGEDGFEIFCASEDATTLWDSLLEAGEPKGLEACGLGARDTLRLEAGLCLYGNDIDETTTPLEARLGWLVKLDKGDFLGRDVLARQKEEGVERRLTGFKVTGRGIARHGYPVLVDGKRVGQVTSGSHSPTLGHPVGLAYLPMEHSSPDRPFEVLVRDKPVACETVKLPFYRSGDK